MFELRTLGSIDLRDEDGTPVSDPLRHAKRVALLAYLATPHPPRFQRRETLVALLWPDLDESHGRGMLRHELYELRRVLGREAFLGDGGDLLRLNEECLWCDARAFTESLDSGFLLKALELVRGDFLPGLHVDGTEFERWLDGERGRFARRAGIAADRLTARAARNGELKAAVQWARRWTEITPYDEPAWRRLISLLDRAGDRAGALDAFDGFARRFREELEIDPAPDTLRLIERIRSGRTNGGLERTADGNANAPRGPVRASSDRGSPPPSTLIVVAVRPVQNRTGDPRHDVLAARLSDKMVQGISELAYLEVVVGAEVPWTTAVVSTSLYSHGDGLEVSSRLAEAGDGGRVLFAAEPAALASDPEDDELTAVVARMMAAAAAHYDPRVPIAFVEGLPVHTPTWESWLEYIQGAEAFGAYRFEVAARRLHRAYEIDHRFLKAAIFGALARTYCGDVQGADELVSGLLEADTETASDYERYFGAYFLADLRGQRWEAYRACKEILRLTAHPVLVFLAGREAYRLNRPEECIHILEGHDTGFGWWRNWAEWWEVFGGAHHLLGLHHAELDNVLRGRARVPEALEPIRAEVRTRAALGEPQAVLSLLEEALRLPAKLISPADVAWTAAQELDVHGYPEAGAAARQAGLTWLGEQDSPSRLDRILEARLLLETGRSSEAGERLGSAKELAAKTPLDDLEFIGLAGLLKAGMGDEPGACEVIEQLEAIRDPHLSGRHLLIVAGIRVALGQADLAFGALRRAFAAGLPFGVELHALPSLRPLAETPELDELLRPKRSADFPPAALSAIYG